MDKLYIIIIAIVFILLIMVGLAIVNYTGQDLIDKYREYSKIPTSSTPVDFVNTINSLYFENKIKLRFVRNELGDSYNGYSGILRLCQVYAHEHNLVGITICAHELGHALQFQYERKKMAKFSKRRTISNFLSKLTIPCLIASIVLLILNHLIVAGVLACVAVLTFLLALITKVSTIKVEKDASKKAIDLIEKYAYFTEGEMIKAKEFLNLAKKTYIADLLRSMLKWTMLVKK